IKTLSHAKRQNHRYRSENRRRQAQDDFGSSNVLLDKHQQNEVQRRMNVGADVAEYLGQTMTANLPRPQFVEPQRLLIQAAKSQQCCKDDQKAKMNHSCRRVDTA
ncbi:MAG TPA: hypothetical protein PKA58_15465, partial [Polyangium sp.]|nr:hypothetical protein [Polyangium sp.]